MMRLDEALEADVGFMQIALAAARHAVAAGEVPIGAVVVVNGRVVANAHNSPVARCDPTAHAEVLVLREGAQRMGNYRLPGAILYTTVEPCAMCVGAALQARVARIVFGCRDPKAGALGSVCDLAQATTLNHRFAVRGGVCAEDARRLLQEFFRARRSG